VDCGEPGALGPTCGPHSFNLCALLDLPRSRMVREDWQIGLL
jgi:hypothetical protein